MNTSKPVLTKDGSHTLFNERAGEHYHSVFGAIQESEHIFIQAGLKSYKQQEKELRVLEIGFGTGLNALLSLKWAEEQKQLVRYLGVEAFPLTKEVLKSLNYASIVHLPQLLFLNIHKTQTWQQISPFFTSRVIDGKFQEFHPDTNRFHVIFFDAFSPDSQPEMWTEVGFIKLYNALVSGGILVTYSCKGTVKRALKAAGFSLEKLPGPPGKREFLRATAQK